MANQAVDTYRGLLRSAWRALSSLRLALWLLFGLLLCLSLATLLPQAPTSLDQELRAAWMALAAQRLGRLYPLLSASGLLDIYHSPGFRLLVAVLLLNTVACTLQRARSLARQACQGRTAALGTLITHLSVVALVLSIAASQAAWWQQTTAPLGEGQTCAIEHRPGWTIRNDGLRLLSSEQQIVSYSAKVSLMEDGQTLRKGEIRPNAPFRLASVGVWLLSYEPGVAVRLRDTQDQPLLVQHTDGQPTLGQVSANLSSGPALMTAPSAGLEMLVSAPQSALPSGGFQLTVRSGSTGEVLLSEEVLSGSDTVVDEILVALEASPYAAYRIKHDPARVALLVAALAVVAGTALSLFTPKGNPR